MTEPALEEFLTAYPADVRQLALQARTLILSIIPGAVEMVDPPSKIIAYGLGRKYSELICAIAPYQTYINLMFSRGVDLPDPAGLLQGTGKRARHVKIGKPQEISNPALRALIEIAKG